MIVAIRVIGREKFKGCLFVYDDKFEEYILYKFGPTSSLILTFKRKTIT